MLYERKFIFVQKEQVYNGKRGNPNNPIRGTNPALTKAVPEPQPHRLDVTHRWAKESSSTDHFAELRESLCTKRKLAHCFASHIDPPVFLLLPFHFTFLQKSRCFWPSPTPFASNFFFETQLNPANTTNSTLDIRVNTNSMHSYTMLQPEIWPHSSECSWPALAPGMYVYFPTKNFPPGQLETGLKEGTGYVCIRTNAKCSLLCWSMQQYECLWSDLSLLGPHTQSCSWGHCAAVSSGLW